ncbi:MAG: hypothetical protein ACLRRA_08370 [Acutalibacteraceae bacterium]
MKQYHAKQILNIALAGHSSSGKTTVAEAMLFLSGGLNVWEEFRRYCYSGF